MDRQENLLKHLECPVCLETCVAPIYQCVNGHNMCPYCSDKITRCALCREPMTSTRNRFAEEISAQLQGTRKMGAEKSCVLAPTYRCYIVEKYSDGFDVSDQCQWKGDISYLLAHCLEMHEDYVIVGEMAEIECGIKMDLDYGSAYVRLLSAFEELFWCIVFYDPGESNVHLFMRFVGDDETASRFQCEHRLTDRTSKRKLIYVSEPLKTAQNIRAGCKTLQLSPEMVGSFSTRGKFKYTIKICEK